MTALRALVTIGVAAIWFVLVAPPMFQTPPTIYTGITPANTGAPLQLNLIRVKPGSPAYDAGLRTGDVLGCMSKRDWALLLVTPTLQQAYTPGTLLTTCVRRNGTLRTIRFAGRAGPPLENTYGSDALVVLRICVFLVFFIIGIALVMARPSLMTWIFYVFCLGSAPSFAAQEVWSILPPSQFFIAYGVPGLGAQTAVAFLLLFTVLVPNQTIPSGWRRVAFYAATAVLLADVGLAIINNFYAGVTVSSDFANGIDEGLTTITVLLVAARLATMERFERARFGWAAFAIVFGVIVNDLRNVLSASSSHELESVSLLAAYLTVVMPLTLMYAILKRHVIDVRFVISRTVVYAVLTTFVVAVIGAVDWMTSAYLSQVRVAMAIDAAVTIGLAFLLHRAYGWIERVVDYLLYRRKHAAEIYLNRLAKTLLRSEREETIDRALVHAPYEKLDLAMAALFRAQGGSFIVSCAAGWDFMHAPAIDAEHELVRFLATERCRLEVKELRSHVVEHFQSGGSVPAVAVPIFQGDELTAFAVYGIHRDGTKLDPDEIETLERLCEVAAQGYVRIELLRYRALSASPLPA
ncbi:MAG TPA: hypothetical protein VJP85_01640 [Candidatus Baltobacteraceae bacterium]|nr:hypothetical protein [Candidatus Baltobacteraceae bacterium]